MKNLFALIFAVLMLSRAEAQLVAWNLSGATGNEVTRPSNVGNGNIEISALSRGTGVAVVPANSAFAGEWPQNVSEQTENLYYEFTIKAKEGYVVSLSSIDVKLRIQANGPSTYIWKYSLDGGGSFTDIGTPYTLTTGNFDFSNNDGIQQPTLDISGICALQNLSSSQPVVFRVYAWNTDNGSNPAGARGFRIGRSTSTSEHALVVDGSAVSAAAPLIAWNLSDASGDEEVSVSNIRDDYMEPRMELSILSRGNGITASAAGDSYASVWPQIANQTEGCYYEFTVAPKVGYIASLHALDVKLRIQTNGPKTYIWKYSINGGASFIDIGTPYTWTSSIDLSNNDGVHQPGVDLSGIAALQNISSDQSVIFRIYAWNSGNATSGFRIGKSLSASEHALAISGIVQDAATMPVKLLSFNGKKEGATVLLDWTTVSEQNNSHFEILRSSGREQNTVIGTVNGNGTSNKTHHYNFTDYSPLQGVNYYQLRQVDYDGRAELSEIVTITIDLNNSEMKVSASETETTVYVHGSVSGEARLYISDITGRLLIDKSVELNGGDDVLVVPGKYAKGIYIASIVMANGKRLSVKFYM